MYTHFINSCLIRTADFQLKSKIFIKKPNFSNTKSCRYSEMQRFSTIFKHNKCNVIGMIHVDALPGTPNHKPQGFKNEDSWKIALEKAKHEANVYAKYNLDSVLVENMHDIPYVLGKRLGPETTASMTKVCSDVRSTLPQSMSCGLQILACGNQQALAVAKAAGLQYIRSEGFVFGHVADEGYVDACAGDLLRYRKQIDAEDVLIFADIKKKHSSHAITQDVGLLETAKAAEFFLADGVIITGNATGHPASPQDLKTLAATESQLSTPLLVGSGVTCKNLELYFALAHAVIVGSHFKVGGHWANELHEPAIDEFMRKVQDLRNAHKTE